MKKYIIFIATLCLFTCQDSKEDLKTTAVDITYYKSVGEQIPFETGMRWIELYNQTNNTQGRENAVGIYSIPAAQVQAMLQSVPNVIAVAFHYGIDALGVKHVIAIPFDATLSLFSSIPGRIYIDTNTGNAISQSVALTWAGTYRTLYPNQIWFHYFGKTVFDEILGLPYFSALELGPAINNIDLSPQLLLVIWNETLGGGLLGGRTSGEGATIYDASNPCPPCAVN